jgi:sugar/nucleoside kinase (ribokinase family)
MNSGLLAIGLTTLDIVGRPIEALTHTERAQLVESIVCAPAGTAAGAALVAAKLGVPVKLAGSVGDDMNGAFVRVGLERVGVDVSLLQTHAGLKTSTTLLTVPADGRRSSYHMLGAGGAPPINDEVFAAARSARFVHYAAVGGQTTDGGPGEAFLRAAKEGGAIVTCDLIGPRASAAAEIERLAPFIDYFMPSAAEAMVLTGTDDLAAAASRFLAMGAKACVIKNGRNGALVWIDGRHSVVPAFDVTPKDTTSCGDSFCAGFIAALARNWTPLDALRFASMTAGLVSEGCGTLGGIEGFDETVAAMATHAPAPQAS